MTLDFLKQMMQEFKEGKRLAKRYAFAIMLQAKAILSEQPTILELPVPAGSHFTVCGDVHGQFFDLLNIFELNGLPSPENPYLFNGDFVDRGSWSVEVILTLLGFKVLYPNGARAGVRMRGRGTGRLSVPCRCGRAASAMCWCSAQQSRPSADCGEGQRGQPRHQSAACRSLRPSFALSSLLLPKLFPL